MIDLCGGCGHSMEGHVSNPCGHDLPDGERCKCPAGMRADVMLCQQMGALFGQLNAMNDFLAKLLILAQIATGQQVKFSRNEDGKRVTEISPFEPQGSGGGLVLPFGH